MIHPQLIARPSSSTFAKFNRRMHPIHDATQGSLLGGLSKDEFYTRHGVLHHETYMLNGRRMKIFTQSWRPAVKESLRGQHDADLPAFLYGESLGGAVAMLVCLRQPDRWAGLVLSGASAKYKPVWPLEKLLPLAAALFSSWKLVIMKPLADLSYREEWKRRLVRKDPDRVIPRKPTAASAQEFMRVCEEIKKRSRELETPLLVLHGEDDKVCDIGSAQMVYSAARSRDKTIKVLPGMWHQFIGEPEGGVELAFGIVFSWLKERAAHKVAPSTNRSS